MTNFEAIKQMNEKQIEAFLDCVYLTGYHAGSLAGKIKQGEGSPLLDFCPYHEEWLTGPAEDATRLVFTEDGDEYLPDALVEMVLKVAGIEE